MYPQACPPGGSRYRDPARPVGPEDRTWVAPADGTGVKLTKSQRS
jgi:hypothetical protein